MESLQKTTILFIDIFEPPKSWFKLVQPGSHLCVETFLWGAIMLGAIFVRWCFWYEECHFCNIVSVDAMNIRCLIIRYYLTKHPRNISYITSTTQLIIWKEKKKIVRIEILDLKYSCVFLKKQIQKNNNKKTTVKMTRLFSN